MTGWTDEEARERARKLYGSDEIEVDVDAQVTQLDEPGPVEGAAWVAAWLFVPPKEES